MIWTVPIFLAGLAALTVPIVLHLMHRPIPRRVVFPSIRFIMKGMEFQSGKKRLRDLPTLLARLLVLTAIVLLFAGPALVKQLDLPGAVAEERVVLLIDLSASLHASDFERFLEQEVEAILSNHPDAPMALIASADEVVEVIPFTSDHQAIREAAGTLAPLPVAGDHRAAIERLQSLVDPASPQPLRLYVLSDLQQHDWAALTPTADLPQAELIVRRPWEKAPGNLAILSVTPEVFQYETGRQLRATVLVRNFGLQPATATLQIVAGSQQLEKAIELGSESSAKYVLDMDDPGANICQANLLVEEPYTLDNTYHFWIGRKPPTNVAIVFDKRDRNNMLQAFFIQQALSTTAPGAENFDVKMVDPEFIFEAELAEFQTLIFVDSMGDYSTIEMDMVAGFLSDGGTGIYITGQRSAETFITMNRSNLVQTRFLGFQGDFNQLRTFFIRTIDRESPLMAPFAEETADLLLFPIYRLGKLQPPATAETPLMVDEELPFLVIEHQDKGRLLLLSTALSPTWSELPTSMSFLPLMRQMASASWQGSDRRIVRLQVGENPRQALDAVGMTNAALPSAKPGVYVLDGLPVEVNISRAESDLRPADVYELQQLDEPQIASESPERQPRYQADDERLRSLRPYLALALLILLCLEVFIANYRLR